MPQELMISGDVFQEKMTTIFSGYNDVIAYIDNILLATKSSFNQHIQRLQQILIVLRRNNLHVHVEGTFLASNKEDYLGYTLTKKGIQPQISKILPILRLDRPKNRRQLRSFLGFVNYYKKMWYQRSHVLEPLTRISSDKTKFKWTPVQ